MGSLVFPLIAAALVAGGYFLGHKPAPAPRPLVCRPSNPPAFVARHPGTRLLLVGNSLLFDHDWRVPGAIVVNCARQGLTARAALDKLAEIPGIAPDMILLGFGSVEAYRAAKADLPLPVDDFAEAAKALVEALRARWPEADILFLTVPDWPGTPEIPALTRPADARALSAAIERLAQGQHSLGVLDMNALPAMREAGLYDGLHPARAVHEDLEQVLTGLLRAGM